MEMTDDCQNVTLSLTYTEAEMLYQILNAGCIVPVMYTKDHYTEKQLKAARSREAKFNLKLSNKLDEYMNT